MAPFNDLNTFLEQIPEKINLICILNHFKFKDEKAQKAIEHNTGLAQHI